MVQYKNNLLYLFHTSIIVTNATFKTCINKGRGKNVWVLNFVNTSLLVLH